MKKGLFIFIILVLILPVSQQIFDFPKMKVLRGYFAKPKYEAFSWETYFSGEYQASLNKYVEKTIGYRPDLVRINNQLDYTLYGKINANSVVVGKENYLYEINYIKAYLGRDFIGEEVIDEKLMKARAIQDTLEKLGTHLFFTYAPGKVTFFPEYIPDEFEPENKSITNYEVFIEKSEKHQLNYIDFNQWFLSMKDTTSYPLYPQSGIHWSTYGAGLAMDSLITYMEDKSGKEMVHLYWDDIEVTYDLQKPDYDIGEGLNLFFKIPHYPMAYPSFKYTDDEGKYKPNFLSVSDSFYWQLFGVLKSHKFYDNSGFMYYFKDFHKLGADLQKVEDLDLQTVVEEQDFIMLMATDANLHKYPYGFIEAVYELYYPTGEVLKSQKN